MKTDLHNTTQPLDTRLDLFSSPGYSWWAGLYDGGMEWKIFMFRFNSWQHIVLFKFTTIYIYKRIYDLHEFVWFWSIQLEKHSGEDLKTANLRHYIIILRIYDFMLKHSFGPAQLTILKNIHLRQLILRKYYFTLHYITKCSISCF